jgi:hypothetical protein
VQAALRLCLRPLPLQPSLWLSLLLLRLGVPGQAQPRGQESERATGQQPQHPAAGFTRASQRPRDPIDVTVIHPLVLQTPLRID